MENLIITVSGMTCAACAKNVERILKKIDGVENPSVNYGAEKVTVSYDEDKVSFETLNTAVKRGGYELHLPVPDEAARTEERKAEELKALWKRFYLSMWFALPLTIFSMIPMFLHEFNIAIPRQIDPMAFPAFNMNVQMILTIPVMIINWKIFRDGFRSLFLGHPNMDSLIAKGTTVAFLYSFYLTIQNNFFGGNYMPYYEVTTIIITLIVLGKYLEAKTRGKTSEAIKKLMGLAPKTATILKNNEQIEIPIEDVKEGDIVVVKPGERMPVDGIIVFGETSVDESMITGESMPVTKKIGDNIIGASINKNGFIHYKTTKVGKNTVLSQIINMVEQAQATKAPIARLADLVSGYFTHAVIIIALISGLAWIIAGAEIGFAIRILIAVLVIACPCALGLATPTAIMVGTGKGAESGILIKSAEALEISHKLNTIVLDKTGTITEGKPNVTDIVTKENFSKDEILRLVASSEKQSEHPLGEAIVNYAEEKNLKLSKPTTFKSITGQGIYVDIEELQIFVGNKKLMEENNINIEEYLQNANELSGQGKTPMYVAINGKMEGIVAVADTIKPTSKKAIKKLKDMGLEVIMITGDNERTAKAVANEVGIDKIFAEVLPGDKATNISKLQAEGKKVAMVGDGINDAVALVKSDVGIAIGQGTDIAMESANIVLMRGDLNGVYSAIYLSKKTIRNIKQNLFWAFGYNVLGIPIAMGVLYIFGGPLMNPMHGAWAMSFSSISVLLNVLRLKSLKLQS
ncbi:MAG: heavy metal translocating P-type ATPase [Defluviitaleaceae bacterium]|nr:heavy metal translocating P-type ATPase [Defluviitaleaceae bacterium]